MKAFVSSSSARDRHGFLSANQSQSPVQLLEATSDKFHAILEFIAQYKRAVLLHEGHKNPDDED
jgi:hypothetical protein